MKIAFNRFGEFVAETSGSRIESAYRDRYLALLPVVLACVVSTGYQYLTQISQVSAYVPTSWHGQWVYSMGWSDGGITAANVIASGLFHWLPIFIVACIAGGICERVFSMQRGRSFDKHFIYIALVFSLMVPPLMSVFQLCLGMLFGMLFGREIFGGEGKSFLHPALAGMAFLQIAYPGFMTDHPLWSEINGYAGTDRFNLFVVQTTGNGDSAIVLAELMAQMTIWKSIPIVAAFIGGGYLLLKHLVSSRLIAGVGIGVLTASVLALLLQSDTTAIPWYTHFIWGGLVFSVFFIAADPSSACVTNAGRWIQGLVMGWLLVLLRTIHPMHPEFTVPVLFLGSMLAPLIDQVVISLHTNLRTNDNA